MNRSLFIDGLKLLLIFGAIWGIFWYFPIFKGKGEWDVPVAKEEQLGDAIVENLLENDPSFQEVQDPVVDSAVFIIQKRLLSQVGLTDYDYDIRVVKDERVNAFTLPGGYIFICSGLLRFSEEPEEVASVLAHEIGHVEKRHVVDRLVREFGTALLFAVIGGDQGGAILGEISRTTLSSAFNRHEEAEADQYALELMERSKVDPRILGTFFRRLKNEKGTYPKELELLMDHPSINSRIKKAMNYRTENEFESSTIQLDWERVKGQLDAPQSEDES